MDSYSITMSELANLRSTLSSKPSVLMVGLDSVGKSKILHKLPDTTARDVFLNGISAHVAYYKDMEFILWDISGRMKKLKMFLSSCFKTTKAVILVVDSSDRERVNEAADQLKVVLSRNQCRDAVLLVFANKQDRPNIMPVSELIEKLKLNKLENRRWHIQPTSAIRGTGLKEGMNWVYDEITK